MLCRQPARVMTPQADKIRQQVSKIGVLGNITVCQWLVGRDYTATVLDISQASMTFATSDVRPRASEWSERWRYSDVDA